ncbi:uncharacterized protein MAM_03442 [Metarhizium album ARSEF 1941]|uniref:HNH nuclease domain-containing protein n=1 Tax=Metarhizium album (strain ARSEF 1941) TaxID=1081103 RepID=A0A0B2X1L4_METAS|nr:uncharacterized protein MAM_03442 [Metarhizium album ARSEF 1941]KHN98980.1 hypothetical protein MAM_03442 [Metarhizium album ARSEF 1941]
MAMPLLRHQSSLEGFINFSSSTPLQDIERLQAKTLFYKIVVYYENQTNITTNRPYNRPKLVRLTYEYAITEASRDNVLRSFFDSIGLSMSGDVDLSCKETEANVWYSLKGFADFLIDNFFLPLKASSRGTPQPSPTYRSAVQRTRTGERSYIGTSGRLKTLRGDCLVRDRHRCVISGNFDTTHAVKLMQECGGDAVDDQGSPLLGETFEALEVAHILPHSLTQRNPGSELDKSRIATLEILNMFDSDVAYLIEGPEIDRPRNALSLTHNLHLFFGEFKIFFEPVEDLANTYKIDTFLPYLILNGLLPKTRTLFITEQHTIDPPSPRLLAIHRAIAHILHLSAAGLYIERILQDAEDEIVRADGSTALDKLVQLRLAGWV